MKNQGFNVTEVSDPDGEKLRDTFENFIGKYGFDLENRLLFFFSGHGHTRKDGKKGYIVPADAPLPNKDEKNFLRKAVSMSQILTWARRIESKHALFLFDSCFSGTVFKSKSMPKYPPQITNYTSRPVRQFISAGSAGQEVPAESVFTPLFIRAVKGDGDLNKDGYITGTEIGIYLQENVLKYNTGQTPQYGKIRDPELDEGDFVFFLADNTDKQIQNISISIDQIESDKYIKGRVKGLEKDKLPLYKVVVYVHTDIWYKHPKEQSWAEINENGEWTIGTVKHKYSADKIAVLLINKNKNLPSSISEINLLPNLGIIVKTLIGTNDYGKL